MASQTSIVPSSYFHVKMGLVNNHNSWVLLSQHVLKMTNLDQNWFILSNEVLQGVATVSEVE